MAERRMFAKTIIDSDAFIDMPLTAQAFYFHLSMRADDDGFVNNPKKIQRMIGCADDDMRLLIAKRFIIPFESGVCVIKHWKIHNYIQNDRYKETVYQDEKRLLITKENRAYSLPEEACIQNGYMTDTQNRLDKNSKELDKDSTSQSEDASLSLSVDYQSIVDMFNSICASLPKVKAITDQRRKAIKAICPFIEENGGFQAFFERVQASDFLSGRTENKWAACFDWVIKRANAAKIIEGNYDNRSGSKKSSGSGEETPDYTDTSRYKNASMEV